MSAPQFIDVGGLRTRVRLEGEPEGRPVVLLHGIGRSLEDWEPQYELLAEGNRLIAMDLPGFGYSQRRPEPSTLHSFAAGVLATLDALGETRRVHLIGNSLGGAVALQVLGDAPARVASVVLVNSGGFGKEVSYLLRALGVPGLGRTLLAKPTRLGNLHVERALYADKTLATKERVAHALKLGREPGAAGFMAETAMALGTIRGVRPEWRRALLDAARQDYRPMLIIWGDKDQILPARHFDVARRTFPVAKHHMFTGTGHMPQIERPKEFAELVQDFYAGIG
jgi:pimeloyl-ACP methyl ester carboxylesterase